MHFRARGLALVATVGLLAAACGGGDSDTDAGATTEPTGDDTVAAEGALVVWADETRAVPIREIGEDFTAETGVEVQVVEKAEDTLRDDFSTQAPAGQGPDIIVGAHDWVGSFVANGLITPVELGDKAADYEQIALDAFSFEGQAYGLPYAIENVALFRNTDLAPDAPESWDDLVATGQQLVADGAAEQPFLLELGGGGPYHSYPLQTSFGSFVFGQTEDGSWNPEDVQLDNEGGLTYADQLAEWGEQGILSTSVNGDIAKGEFAAGNSPYWVTGPWNISAAEDGGINFVVEAIPAPGPETAAPFVGAQGFMISNLSENKLAANEFVVNFLGSEEVALALFDIGSRAPALISAFEQVSDDPIIQAFGDFGSTGSPLPNIPEMNAVWDEWSAAIDAIVQGDASESPQELWTIMADKVRENIAASG